MMLWQSTKALGTRGYLTVLYVLIMWMIFMESCPTSTIVLIVAPIFRNFNSSCGQNQRDAYYSSAQPKNNSKEKEGEQNDENP